MNKKFLLVPLFDSAKSFYNKAYTIEYYDVTELYSYDTLVLTLYYYGNSYKYELNNNIDKKLLFSNTTLRHIKEFLKQKEVLYFLDNITKKDIIENNDSIILSKYAEI